MGRACGVSDRLQVRDAEVCFRGCLHSARISVILPESAAGGDGQRRYAGGWRGMTFRSRWSRARRSVVLVVVVAMGGVVTAASPASATPTWTRVATPNPV